MLCRQAISSWSISCYLTAIKQEAVLPEETQLLSEDQFLHVHSNAPLDPLPLSSFLSRPHPDAQASVRMHVCAHCWTTHACGNLCALLSYSRVQWGVGRDWVQSACKTNFQMLFYLPDFGHRDIKAVLKQIRVSSASALSCEEPIKPNCSSKEFFHFSLTEIYHFYTAYRCLTSRRSWVQNPPAGWSLYVLSVPAWVLSGYSCTIQQYKDMHVRINWWSAKEPQIRWQRMWHQTRMCHHMTGAKQQA